jgi:putative DNA primase/helicase
MILDQFLNAIRAAGLEPPAEIIADGKIHRFSSSGKRDDTAGWYVSFPDWIPAGAFGDWRTGLSEIWRADIGRTLTPHEEEAHRKKIEAMRRLRDRDQAQHRTKAKSKAAAIWKAAQPITGDHPYLIAKAIKPHGIRIYRHALVIPIGDNSGEILSLQFIEANGRKRFLSGGQVAKCYFSVGDPTNAPVLCIAEGFATGATIYEATGFPIAVAFSAGNLEAVAQAIREKFSAMYLIICADDDIKSKGNPGLSKASAAATVVGAKLAIPNFGAKRPDGASDFNDLAALRGISEVKKQIQAAIDTPPQVYDPIAEILEAAGVAKLKKGGKMVDVESAMRALSQLLKSADDIRRAAVREAVLRRLTEIDINAPARLVDAAMPKTAHDDSGLTGHALLLTNPEPWEQDVDVGMLLDEITVLVRRYVVLSAESAHAVALWVIHAWALDAFDVSALLAITSPTKRCGKTTLLEIVGHMTPRAVSTANITAAALFRTIEKFSPTLLIDEADTFLSDNDELRGTINSGHRRSSAFVVRTVGDNHEPTQFKTWGPKAIALIGKLPSTLEDRSIPITMRRRTPGEMVARFRSSECEAAASPLRQKAFRWAADHIAKLHASDPPTPDDLNDRAADNWRPLIAIGDIAGGEWPERARGAARSLSADFDEADGSAVINLLCELKEIFEDSDRTSSADLIKYLGAKNESRWAEWSHGRPITERQVARLLAPLKIKPDTIRIGDKTAKGYLAQWFVDAFSRYLPRSIRNTVTDEQLQSVTPETIRNMKNGVPDREESLSAGNRDNVTAVTDRDGELWEEIS